MTRVRKRNKRLLKGDEVIKGDKCKGGEDEKHVAT